MGGGTPRDCGTVSDRNVALPVLASGTRFPLLRAGNALNRKRTVDSVLRRRQSSRHNLVIAHHHGRQFDAEDLRVMINLGTFAAAACRPEPAARAEHRSDNCGDLA